MADPTIPVRYPGGEQGRALDQSYAASGNVPYWERPGYAKDLAERNAATAAASRRYKGYQQGGKVSAPVTVEAIEGRTPTPKVRGNLPLVRDQGAPGGREVPARPMEWHERANPRSSGGGSLKQGPWENPPQPPPGIPSRDIADLASLHRTNPELYSDPAVRVPEYSRGGMVKHGSSTRITCRSKHG